MSTYRIAARYAKSLLDLATEQNKLDRVVEDIEHFQAASKVRDLYLLLKSPIVNTKKKSDIFKALFAEHYDELSMAFLQIILRKGREMYLPEIADEFIEEYQERQGISNVKVTTAIALTQDKLDLIKQRIREAGVTRENLILDVQVDPSIIGGLIIEFEDKLFDASVAHQIEMMRKEFSSNT